VQCGWGCGEQLTASRVRPHSQYAPNGRQVPSTRPTREVLEGQAWVASVGAPTGAGDEMRLGLRRTAHGEPDAVVLHRAPRTQCDWRCGIRGSVVEGCSDQTRHLPERDFRPLEQPARFRARVSFRMRKINRPIVTSPTLSAKPLKRQVDWPVNLAFTGPICARALNLRFPLRLGARGHHDWPVNAVIQAKSGLLSCKLVL
jgi:hypothetical protein